MPEGTPSVSSLERATPVGDGGVDQGNGVPRYKKVRCISGGGVDGGCVFGGSDSSRGSVSASEGGGGDTEQSGSAIQ